MLETDIKTCRPYKYFNTSPANKTYFQLSHIPQTDYNKVTKQVVWPKLWTLAGLMKLESDDRTMGQLATICTLMKAFWSTPSPHLHAQPRWRGPMKGIFGWSSGAGQTINRGAEIMRHAKWQNGTMLVKAAETVSDTQSFVLQNTTKKNQGVL